MGITVSDIKRAMLGGGDVSAFAEVWHQALGNPSVPSVASLETPVALPETTALLKHIDKNLEKVVAVWAEGKDYRLLPEAKIDLTLIGLAPYGRNIAGYLEHIIDEVKPDIIALDTPPLELSAGMLYALSIPCAVGLPIYGQIMTKDLGQFYAQETFYPGSMNQTAIVKSWLAKIPLVPVGIPRRQLKYLEADFMMAYVDETSMNQGLSKSNILEAYRALDESLSDVTELQKGLKISKDICLGLIKTIGSKMRDTLVEEACYTASRIMEIAACANTPRRKARLLAIVDITRYPDVEYVIDLLGRGITDEIYVPPKSYAAAKDMVMTCRYSDELNEQAEEYAPTATLTQELFQSELDRLIKTRDSEALAESVVDKLIPQIVNRTRTHPDTARGTSVRGTIAFKEVVHGLSEMKGVLTRDAMSKAALITLPPRIVAKHGGNETAMVSDIVKEVLYDMRFSRVRDETLLPRALDWLSSEDIMESLKNLEPLSQGQSQELPQKKLPAVVAEQGKNRQILKYLESKNFLKKGQQNRYSFTKKALEYLMNDLEQKLKADEITPAEYNRQKARLAAMLENASQPQLKMSAKELANTVMELMDAQDKQRSREVSFERMHVYYHIKANSMGSELSPQKRDYYSLKTLIDNLEKQGILSVAEIGEGLTLTSQALNILMDYLIDREPRGRGFQGAIDFGETLANERKPEVRRYSSGDVFRDISFRHTLKEIARQKKDLSSVRKGDFKVFIKQRRKLQSDIVLCLDISGSMGSQYKLMYARLAAAGLAKAAIENGDRVGMIAFNNFGQTTMPLTDKDADSLMNCIAKVFARGNTNIGDGIKCSSELLFQSHSNNQKYIVLITDGQPTAISERTFNQLKELKEKDLSEESAILETRKASARGVKVSVIHIASKHEGSEQFIKNIARIGKGKVRRVSSSEDLETIMR